MGNGSISGRNDQFIQYFPPQLLGYKLCLLDILLPHLSPIETSGMHQRSRGYGAKTDNIFIIISYYIDLQVTTQFHCHNYKHSGEIF